MPQRSDASHALPHDWLEIGDAEFFEMSLDHLCVAGFDGYWKRVNPSWTRTLGWSREELTSRPLIEFCHPDDREGVLAARRRLFAGLPVPPITNRYRCKDGSYRWFEWRSVSNVDRRLVYAIARDVTAEKDAQRINQELTESLKATLNGIAEGVIATRADGAVARMNPVAERLTGWSASEAMGKPLSEVFRTFEDRPHSRLLRRDGTELPIAVSRAPLESSDGGMRGAVLVFRDMTAENEARDEQERLQRQLVLADRMASLGTLAAGVAHEINNPLAYIVANIDVIVEELARVDDTSLPARAADCVKLARDARDGADRIRRIVRGLMTFSRSDAERRAVIDVHPVIELSIDMTLNEIRHRARLVKDYGAVPPVEADDSRLGQVFINLLVNAAQAIPEGDTEGNEIRIVTRADEAGRAVIEVGDTGPGIPESVLPRIFDPFFTTKPIGVGTGLGLSICHTIVTSMGGQITASNGPSGAVFRLVLPPAPARGRASKDSMLRPVRATPAVRRAAVLVVDDDRAVAASIRRVLRAHDVTLAASAEEALDRILADERFDVILSDLMMPGMSGMDLYDELARRRAPMAERMVFITGGAFTPAASAFLDRVPNRRLEKPFSPEELRAVVEKLAR